MAVPTKKDILTGLVKRRADLRAAYDAAAGDPESFSLSGAVSATSRKLADLRSEIASLDAEIAAFLAGGRAGLTLSYPEYVR